MTVETSVTIENSNSHEAFDAILDEANAQFWMPFVFIIEPKVGGYFAFKREAWKEPATGRIEALDQNKSLRLHFGGAVSGIATLEIAEQPNAVAITVRHEGAFNEAECQEIWDLMLGRLKEYLESLDTNRV
ncbi:MAG: hypothetical protein EXR67_03300 [Dehalococcoidia bacterium]|nr:hypothetical protein [Dehalococcoidia bacterium]